MQIEFPANFISATPYYVKDSNGKNTSQVKGHILDLVEVEKKDNKLVGRLAQFFPDVDVLPVDFVKSLNFLDILICIVEVSSLSSKPKLIQVTYAAVDSSNNYTINLGKNVD